MSERPVQYFTDEYLERCRTMTPAQKLRFLEDFRLLHAASKAGFTAKSKLISLKIPEDLLEAFRKKAEREGVPYQTQIKNLMKEWLLK